MSKSIDLSGVSDQAEQKVTPSGVYTVRCLTAKAVDYTKDEEERQRIDLELEIVSPATDRDGNTLAGRKFRDTLWVSPKSMTRLKHSLKCFGVVASEIDTDIIGGMLSGKGAKAYLKSEVTTLKDDTTGQPAVHPETGKPLTVAVVKVREYLSRDASADIVV